MLSNEVNEFFFNLPISCIYIFVVFVKNLINLSIKIKISFCLANPVDYFLIAKELPLMRKPYLQSYAAYAGPQVI